MSGTAGPPAPPVSAWAKAAPGSPPPPPPATPPRPRLLGTRRVVALTSPSSSTRVTDAAEAVAGADADVGPDVLPLPPATAYGDLPHHVLALVMKALASEGDSWEGRSVSACVFVGARGPNFGQRGARRGIFCAGVAGGMTGPVAPPTRPRPRPVGLVIVD